MRIAKAAKEGKRGKVKSLQWILTHSFYAKALAVKRVTSNKGKNTPGVDGVIWKGSRAKMQAVFSLRQHGYHRHVVAAEAFARVDKYVYEQLWRMLRRRHSKRSKKWLFKKYWTASGKKGVFARIIRYKKKLKLYQVVRVCSIAIRRHRKIIAKANPYLPEYVGYYCRRKRDKESRLLRELTVPKAFGTL